MATATKKKIEIKATKVLRWLLKCTHRFRVLQGAARCSKTYSIAQWIILKCVNDWAGKNKVITIARKTFPALRASVMRDFLEILQSLNIYDEANHNKTTHEYNLSGNLIEFVACDQPQKIKGRKRDICWLNEANEFDYDDFTQFNLRTNEAVFMDYNPSDEYHWIYEKVLTRPDCDFRKFSIFDNPLAPFGVKEEILALKDQDENLWKIYGLGERGVAQDLIFTNWDEKPEFPHICAHYRYGLDFGYTHPTALVFVGVQGDDIYVRQVIYQTHLTNADLIKLMKELHVSPHVLIRADSAEPDRVTEISVAGFKIEGVTKDKKSVKQGIDNLKRRRIHFVNSPDLVKEVKNYRWRKDPKTGELFDEPLKFKDDGMDALRYSVGDILADAYLFRSEEWDYLGRDLPRRPKKPQPMFKI